jgi:hypothetical protein
MPLLDLLRRSRRLSGGWLLCVWLALMPLRGWAEVTLHLAPAGQPTTGLTVLALPCHEAPLQASDRVSVMSPGGSGEQVLQSEEPGGACALCVLCHAPAMPAGETRLAPVPGAAPAFGAVARNHAPPALPLPERPPRS